VSVVQLKLKKGGQNPQYATAGSAAQDIRAAESVVLEPGRSHPIKTNLRVEFPESHVMLVFVRSGLSTKHSVMLTNGVAVIDSDYRGEIVVPLINFGESPYVIQKDERIAQFMLVPIPRIETTVVKDLSPSVRGERGLGSTGKH